MLNSTFWQPLASAVASQWPDLPEISRPSPGGQLAGGFMFSGVVNEVVPQRLMLDSRLTPLERNAWLVFRMLMDRQGFAVPRYKDLQPYLSMLPYGNNASKETISRVLAILRMTRWLSLVTQSRDAVTGRMQGSLYILHEEPVSVREASMIDTGYKALVARCLHHNNRSVRIVAQNTATELTDSGDELPTRIDILQGRILGNLSAESRHKASSSESELSQNSPGSDSEPGKKHRVRHERSPGSASEPGQNSPGSESEPGRKASKFNRVRNPNSDSAVHGTYICTVQGRGRENAPAFTTLA